MKRCFQQHFWTFQLDDEFGLVQVLDYFGLELILRGSSLKLGLSLESSSFGVWVNLGLS